MKDESAKNRWKPAALASLVPVFLLLAAGCGKGKVQVYEVSTDQDQSQLTAAVPATNSADLPPGHPGVSMMGNPSSQMPSGMVASDVQNAQPVTWTTPPGWTSEPPSEMRVASFKVTGAGGQSADVSVVPLPGMAGGDFANVNRWRGQVGLPAASDNDLQSLEENVQAGGQPAELFDLAGSTTRILGAIQHRDNTTWFFKMTGGDTLVEQQKAAFIAFLRSLNFGSPQSQAQLPAGHPDVNDMTAPSPAPAAASGQPSWTVPAAWQPAAAGQFLVAKFTIKSGNGPEAEVNVSSAGGSGGGLEANVNRWRGQLGLPPAEAISTTDFQVSGGQAQLVDLTGKDAQTGQPAELVGVVVNLPGQTWFYKLMGDPSVVAAQKNAFTQFVKSVQY